MVHRYISASLSQLLGGSAILFTAALSVAVLRCHLNWLHWAGGHAHAFVWHDVSHSWVTIGSAETQCWRFMLLLFIQPEAHIWKHEQVLLLQAYRQCWEEWQW